MPAGLGAAFVACRGRILGLLLVLVLSAILCGACDRRSLAGDDLAGARMAIQAHNWILAERLLERCLRHEEDPEKRWEAWQRLLEVNSSAGGGYRVDLDYLEAMLREYGEDEGRVRFVMARMGVIYENLRRFDRAAEVWTTYLERAKLTSEEAVAAHRRLAQIYIRSRRFDAGEDVLQNCLALAAPDVGKAQCLYDLADMHMAREHWKDASGLATQIMDLDVDETLKSLAAFLLGDALEQQHNTAEALQYFERARTAYPNERVVENRIAFLKKHMMK